MCVTEVSSSTTEFTSWRNIQGHSLLLSYRFDVQPASTLPMVPTVRGQKKEERPDPTPNSTLEIANFWARFSGHDRGVAPIAVCSQWKHSRGKPSSGCSSSVKYWFNFALILSHYPGYFGPAGICLKNFGASPKFLYSKHAGRVLNGTKTRSTKPSSIRNKIEIRNFMVQSSTAHMLHKLINTLSM